MDYLTELESKTIYIIREAYSRFKKVGMLWSMGKDSTSLLWMCRKAFFGRIPFPIVHIDTGRKFKEMYQFRDKYARKWNLNLIVIQNKPAIKFGLGPENGSKLECCTRLKTQALKDFLKETKMDAMLLAIRRDEHGIRAKERVFSPRDEDFNWRYQEQQPELWDLFKTSAKGTNHLRIHPMLHWKEIDIWRYTEREKIPIVGLYLSKNGKRYRSLGCACCCAPVDSEAKNIGEAIKELESTTISERSGRAQDKEDAYTMQKLRSLGYM